MAATFGRRLRRGAASTAVAALVLAALTTAQAPAATKSAAASAPDPAPPAGIPIDGDSGYFTDLPPHERPVPHVRSHHHHGHGRFRIAMGPAEAGIPTTVLAAYKNAAARMEADAPGCRLPWQLLAGIGKVESGQARGGAVDAAGTTLTRILGPRLNGHGFARIGDTDGGLLDGDTTLDRAVGPMQFIPSTWSNGGPGGAGWGADGNGDGKKDPHNIFDAALAAGRYLCAGGRDLSVAHDLHRAVLGYNDSSAYLRTVLSWYAFYRTGAYEVPDGKGVLPVHRGGPDGRSHRKHHGGDGHPATGHAAHPLPRPKTPKAPDRPGGSHRQPSPPAPKPAEPARLTALDPVGDQALTATTDSAFAAAPTVRANDSDGQPLAGIPVRFSLTGTTDIDFPGHTTTVTVTTGKDGLATAPTPRAGTKAGTFTLRATAEGRTVPAVDFALTVKAAPAPRADALVRTSDAKVTTTAGRAFADGAVEVRATYRGKAAAGVPVTATMVTDDPDHPGHPVENDRGPYFTDPGATGADKDRPVRTLTKLTTDAHGLLKLPKIATDTRTGTFLLRLTTADGTVLTVELQVTAPAGS
ncbi:lytic transglycosylase [Streptomyces gilvosporeus]|uniref:lytic transglycosylase n=1 Tax=Streptomyces gilvosporeus TaxID=553510 RepID=UPI000D1B7151|nr:lytic transglycosylase [Streptomyces gilvosporeus]